MRDFGARGDGQTDDFPAIDAAYRSLPALAGTTETGQPIRGGTLLFPPGIYLVSQTLLFSAYTSLQGDAAQRAAQLRFGGNPASRSDEQFLIDIDRSRSADGVASANITHGVHIANLSLYGDRARNRGLSGVRIRSAQITSLHNVVIADFALRGLVIGGEDGASKQSTAYVSNLWIYGIERGPGLYVGGQHMSMELLSVERVNTEGANSSASGEPHAAVMIERSRNVNIGVLQSEGSYLPLHISSSQQVSIAGVDVAPLRGSPVSRTAVRISGDSDLVSIGSLRCDRFNFAVHDDSASAGTVRAYRATANPTGAHRSSYVQQANLSHVDSGYLRIGGGSAIRRHLSASTAWPGGTLPRHGLATTIVPCPGAKPGDTTAVGFSGPVSSGVLLSAVVTGADEVTVSIFNATDSEFALGAGTFRTDVWQH